MALQKGFGDETSDLQKKLEEFFNKYGETNAVRMRRVDGNKQFKACFIDLFEKKHTCS
jgi:lupus La protein